MASLKELKLRIGSVKSTQKITKAKQMVAAAKLRKAQAAAEAARPYSERLEAVVASLATKIAGGSGEGASPLLAGTGFPGDGEGAEADAVGAGGQRDRQRLAHHLAAPRATTRSKTAFIRCGPPLTDGPFAETKDLIAGWMVIDVETWERAVELAGELSAAPGKGGEPIHEWLELRPFLANPMNVTE